MQLGGERLAVSGAQRLAERLLDRLVRDGGDEPVAAHADGAVQVPHRDDDAVVAERAVPRDHVLVVGVDEGAVDVEERGGGGGHRARPTRRAGRETRLRPPRTGRPPRAPTRSTRRTTCHLAASRGHKRAVSTSTSSRASASRGARSVAEEIAARTVNKERARSGESRTASRTSSATSLRAPGGLRSGTARAKGRTRDQLYARRGAATCRPFAHDEGPAEAAVDRDRG